MASFELPVWSRGQSFELEADLMHQLYGRFRVPVFDHPKAPKEWRDTKEEVVESAWRVDVVAAPESPAGVGEVALNLICTSVDSPFSGSAYRLNLLRERVEPADGSETAVVEDSDEEPPANRVRLLEVCALRPPEPKAADDEAAEEEDNGTVLASQLSAPESDPVFDPFTELGWLFDFPQLNAVFEPSEEAEDFVVDGFTCQQELRDAGGACEFCWSYAAPAAPVVRTTLRWQDGQPWYAELRRESVVVDDEAGTEDARMTASIRLK